MLLAEDISREAMAAIETGLDIPGVKIVSVPRRAYPHGALAAHVLGFMNEISAEELRAEEGRGLPRRRSDRPHRHRAPVGGLPARARRLREDRRRSARPAQAQHPRADRRPGQAGGGAGQQRVPHARRRRAAHRRARAARVPRGGGRRDGRRHRAHPGAGVEAGLRSQRDVGAPVARGRAADPGGPLPPAARQDAERDLLPGLDVQGRSRRWRRWRIG